MNRSFLLADFFGRWQSGVLHDLSASHSETLPLSALLALATPAERARWESLQLEYTVPNGGFSLRALMARRYEGLGADDILCCAGVQEGVACVAQALLSQGDHAVIILPIYQPLEWAVTERATATGVVLDFGRPVLDVERIAGAIRPETRMILTNFPNSPTGAVLDAATQADLVELCRSRGIWLVNDEVYLQTVSGATRPAPPVAEIYERGVSINSLSKGFGLPGLRVGWVACQDPALLDRAALVKASLSGCITAPSHMLAEIALRAEATLIGRARAIGKANRVLLDAFVRRYPALFEADQPANLAFAFPRYLGADGALAFARRLVAEWGTLVFPSELWSSPLAPIPRDRLRISLGRSCVSAGIEAMAAYLDTAIVASAAE